MLPRDHAQLVCCPRPVASILRAMRSGCCQPVCMRCVLRVRAVARTLRRKSPDANSSRPDDAARAPGRRRDRSTWARPAATPQHVGHRSTWAALEEAPTPLTRGPVSHAPAFAARSLCSTRTRRRRRRTCRSLADRAARRARRQDIAAEQVGGKWCSSIRAANKSAPREATTAATCRSWRTNGVARHNCKLHM